MNELQTIREALEKASNYIVGKPSHIPTGDLSIAANCQRALAALDTLAAESSEDAQELANKAIRIAVKAYKADDISEKDINSIADLIEADRQKVREECADRVRAEFKVSKGGSNTIDRACAAIMGGKE